MCRPPPSSQVVAKVPSFSRTLRNDNSLASAAQLVKVSENAKKTPPSILHKSSYRLYSSSIERSKVCSSIPKLVAANEDADDCNSCVSRASSTVSIQSDEPCCQQKYQARVSFYNKVIVQEFHRRPGEEETTWFSAEELRGFQNEALSLVRRYDRAHWFGFFRRPHRILHTHPALAMIDEDTHIGNDNVDTARNQINRILLVDSHDLSLGLFAHDLQRAFPHAVIVAAKGSQDALYLCEKFKFDFDIVVVEERLSLFRSQSDSGSGLLKTIHLTMKTPMPCLFIGVSAHLERDQAILMESGADFCWRKPPPPLNDTTVEETVQALLAKRNDD